MTLHEYIETLERWVIRYAGDRYENEDALEVLCYNPEPSEASQANQRGLVQNISAARAGAVKLALERAAELCLCGHRMDEHTLRRVEPTGKHGCSHAACNCAHYYVKPCILDRAKESK